MQKQARHVNEHYSLTPYILQHPCKKSGTVNFNLQTWPALMVSGDAGNDTKGSACMTRHHQCNSCVQEQRQRCRYHHTGSQRWGACRNDHDQKPCIGTKENYHLAVVNPSPSRRHHCIAHILRRPGPFFFYARSTLRTAFSQIRILYHQYRVHICTGVWKRLTMLVACACTPLSHALPCAKIKQKRTFHVSQAAMYCAAVKTYRAGSVGSLPTLARSIAYSTVSMRVCWHITCNTCMSRPHLQYQSARPPATPQLSPEHRLTSQRLGRLPFMGILGCVRSAGATHARLECVWCTDGWFLIVCVAVLKARLHWIRLSF